MLYVSSQICHGRLIIFHPGATRCWHWRSAWCFFCICLGLLTVGSSQVQTQNWKQLQLATNHETNHVWNRMLVFFLWQDVGKESSFFWLGYVLFLVRLTETVGFGPVEVQTQKWKQLQLATNHETNHVWNKMLVFFLWQNVGKESIFFWLGYVFFLWAWRWRWGLGLLTVGSSQVQTPNWKESVQAGNKSRLEQNARFFSWQEVGKESSLLTGLCIFFWWGWRCDPTDNLHVFFGFLWACWRWVPHRSQNQNWEETIFFKGQSAVLYHEYHTPCASAQNTHHAYHFQIGSTIKIIQTQSPRFQFSDWPTPPRWPFPGSIRSGGGADEQD